MLIKVSNADQFQTFFWVLLALGLGAAVGLEREYRGHEAGVRTNALVCAGAALFAQVSYIFGDDRIASNIVQGVGFLGAGLVFQTGNNVKGITTAATIWVIAAVGLMVGDPCVAHRGAHLGRRPRHAGALTALRLRPHLRPPASHADKSSRAPVCPRGPRRQDRWRPPSMTANPSFGYH